MQSTPKNINSMLSITTGSITNPDLWKKHHIDTLVNTANPTLMGSNQGVDGEIHRVFDEYLDQKYKKEISTNPNPDFRDTLNKNICDELKTSDTPHLIRCERGKAVTTDGYGLCNKIIHVVGAEYDGNSYANSRLTSSDYCTSSCIHTLESCYFNIVKEIKKNSDIKGVAIPIIGSGLYNVPFELAIKIAISSIGNALLEWKTQDEEAFEYAGIEKIVFFVYNTNPLIQEDHFRLAIDFLNKYNYYFSQNQKVVFQTSKEAHFRYLKEIKVNDEKRGYFTLAKRIRYWLMSFRIIFLPILYLKDVLGKESWQKRRKIVERVTLVKAVLPLFFGTLLELEAILPPSVPITVPEQFRWIFGVLIVYCLLDTITYLLLLIILSDIQRPSANIIRSIIMLFVNYIEVGGELAFLYTIFYNLTFFNALNVSFLEAEITNTINPIINFSLNLTSSGIKFFFTTLVFGYFFSHMKQRKFRS